MTTRERSARRSARWSAAIALAAISGCVSLGRTEPPLRHYLLAGDTLPSLATQLGGESPRGSDISLGALSEATIGLRRLKLASYLTTPFIAVRHGPNEVDFSQFNRWGEPLSVGINRAVATSLVSRGLHSATVAPWPLRARYDYVLEIDVVRFEGRVPDARSPSEGVVELLATWEILRQADGAVLTRGTTDFRRIGWAVGDYASLVALLGEGLGVLSGDVLDGLSLIERLR